MIAGSPVHNIYSSFLKFFNFFLNSKIRGPGEKIICENSGSKNSNLPNSSAPKIFILGLPYLVPGIS